MYNGDIKYHRKKLAFTLAETLITLGVIGVVAALTIPTLISKYNEMVTITELRKTYSELSQAIKLSETVNGDFREWEYSSSVVEARTFAEKYIMPYLSRSYKRCTNNKCYLNNKCWKKPNGDLATDVSCSFLNSYIYNNKTISFRTINSSCTSQGITFCTPIKYVEITVDINGDRGPSIMGKDVFNFTLFNYTYKTGAWSTSSVCPNGEHYGLHLGSIAGYWGGYCRNLEDMFSGNPGNCKIDGSGYDCGLAIEKNGWKIPDQYPIKF